LTVIVVMALLMVLMVIVIRDVLKNLFYVVWYVSKGGSKA
jgi:hypothetical protein